MSDPQPPEQNRSVILVGVEHGMADAVLLEAAHLARDLDCELICAHVDLGRYTVEENTDGSVHSLVVAFD